MDDTNYAFHATCAAEGHLWTHHAKMGEVCVRCGIRRDGPTPAWSDKAVVNPFKKTNPWELFWWVVASLVRFVLAIVCFVVAWQTDDRAHSILLTAAGLLLLKREKPVVHSDGHQ